MKNLFLFLTLFSSVSFAGSGAFSSLSIMTYNLENLFDTRHDAGKEDYTYLPLAFKKSSKEVQKYCNELSNEHYKKSCLNLDWNEDILERKLNNLIRVITSAQYGFGADILVFQEVENLNSLKLLMNKGLDKLGYKYISLIEGPDARGIDIGMISRFPIISEKIHTLNLAPHSHRQTRPILEVTYKVGKKTVTVFGNHWPSQGNVDETRIIASEVLREKAVASKSDLVIATGDFNTVGDDLLNGIELNVLPVFEDVEVKGRLFSNVKAEGTHWYRGSWSSLDKIFVKKNCLKAGVTVNYPSFDIIKEEFMVKDLNWTDWDTNETTFYTGIPNRFNSKTGEGYSDHLPVYVEINL